MQVKRQLKSAQEHGLENKDAIHTDSKRINTAKECWEHLSKLFTSSNWSEDHANKKVRPDSTSRYGATIKTWTARGA